MDTVCVNERFDVMLLQAGTVHGGGIEWTIKDGVPYHVPTLMREVKDMVATAPVAKR